MHLQRARHVAVAAQHAAGRAIQAREPRRQQLGPAVGRRAQRRGGEHEVLLQRGQQGLQLAQQLRGRDCLEACGSSARRGG